MKKFLLMFSVIVAMMVIMPNVKAADAYYNVSVEQSEWKQKDDGTYYITKTFYVEKTVGGYVYLSLIETYNVDIKSELEGSNFQLLGKRTTDDGMMYLLKLKDGVTINGKTEVITVTADIIDPTTEENPKCQLDYSPMGLSCLEFEGHYFDTKGNEVSAEDYTAACSGTPTTPSNPNDVESPDTGSVIPYIAVGGGLIAIAGLYLYSRRSNKVYKI